MGYLDNTGLKYFWSKIKNYVDSRDAAVQLDEVKKDIKYLSQNKLHFGTGTDTTKSIVINNCSEICTVLDKIPLLLWGTANYSSLLTMIHLNMTNGHVGGVVNVHNIYGWEVSVTADYYGITINGLNIWGNYVLVAPPGVLLDQSNAFNIPR